MPSTPPRLTPDGRPARERPDGARTGRSEIGRVDDPALSGDEVNPGYANTDEPVPDDDGLVRRDDSDRPLV